MNSLKNLRRRYGRTTLTVTGVALAIAFSTIMLSVGTAIQDSSERIIEETGVDLLIEPVEFAPLFQEFVPIFKLNQARTIANSMKENNSKIRAASPWLTENMYVAKHPEIINASVPPEFALIAAKGSVPEYNRYFGGVDIIKGTSLPTETDPFYAQGTFSGGTESVNFTHEILISKELSKILDISVGELIYLNPVGIFTDFTNQTLNDWFDNATWFKVSGIIVGNIEGQNALTARLHLSELQYISGEHEDDAANTIYVSLHDKDDREEVKEWLETEFAYKDDISVFTPEDLLKDITQFLNIFEGFSSMVIIITILIAALFISTILMISTRERTKEIGALRAIGISKLTISKFIFKESLAICIFGLILGFIIGLIGSELLNQYVISTYQSIPKDMKVTLITPLLIAQVTVITLIISLLASLGPSYWASNVNPADTVRAE
jgi:ABC-type lipoprotein release transport system permease subunit